MMNVCVSRCDPDGSSQRRRASLRLQVIALTKPGADSIVRRPAGCRSAFAPAQVAELVDALVSGTSGATRGGSSPLLGTK